jgi:phage shock protein A
MKIGEEVLLEEKELLTKEFNDLSAKIKQVELNVGQMKANLNAVNGAIQQTHKLLKRVQETPDTKRT